MKKFLAIAVALLTVASVAGAQPRALGLRAGYGGELSYQHNLGGNNFAEFDLGWFHRGIDVAGIYDFMIFTDGNFGFYAGPGATVGLFADSEAKNQISLGVGGQVGLEYRFAAVPLQLSLDWRPMWFLGGYGFDYYGAALGIRYRF